MVNAGKQFESDFRYSIPKTKGYLLQRFNDSSQSYQKCKDVKFTPKNPCDFILFDTSKKILYFLELKSTKYKAITFEDVNYNDEQNKMVHKHQIKALTKFSDYANVVGAFLFNFRDEDNNMERTYYQDIKDFNRMCKDINKQSFNEVDLLLHKAIKISGVKKRIHYIWDIENLLDKLEV